MKLKMAFLHLVFLLTVLGFSVSTLQSTSCYTKSDRFGTISDSVLTKNSYTKCWRLNVPTNTYIQINVTELVATNGETVKPYLKIEVPETQETFFYRPISRSIWKPIIVFHDVTITFSFDGTKIFTINGSFSLDYRIADKMCMERYVFRCSYTQCIPVSKVCDGVMDCESGLDEAKCGKGVISVNGVNASRDNTIRWLKDQRYVGWGRNAHRAITALYLAQALSFRGHNAEEELMAKHLELQTSVALLRNSTEPLSVNELSMFVNALSVTCHDPRRFYGYDLVKILGERLPVAKSPIPGAYLTLCNSNWTLSESDIHSLLHLLRRPSKYPFLLDVQAVTVMALTCLKNLQGKEFGEVLNASNIYDAAVEKFIAGQLSDGSYGNVYTTSLVAQALIASGQENNPKWNYTHTVKYLMKQLNSSSVDFLSAYLALPVFSGRSLVDIASVDCRNISRKQDEDTEISDVTNKIGNKVRVQYSLYVGDQKDVIHTIYLRVPERSSVYDIMRVAQAVDPKYKFSHRDVSGHMYVYEIAGVINDPEAGKFWLMYSEKSKKTIEHYTESPDKLILYDAKHLIMWYKTAHI